MAPTLSPPPAHAAARRSGVAWRVTAGAILVVALFAGAILLRPDTAPSGPDAHTTAAAAAGAVNATPTATPAPSADPASTPAGTPPAGTPSADRATEAVGQAARGVPTASASRSVRPQTESATDAVLRLVNAERARAGCRAVRSDSRLAAAAAAHSADMAAHDYFSHTGRDGSAPGDRVTRAGFRWSRVGENIAAGQATPAAVMTAWMNSSGHRANILNCAYTHLGVGLAYDGRRPVWTQDFGTPAG